MGTIGIADFRFGANAHLTGTSCVARNFVHNPVMVAEVMAAIRPRPGGRYADGTVGGGGHAAAILAASRPTGWLSGCDRDGAALEATRRRLAEFAGRFELRQGNFAELGDWVAPDSCDGVLLDLGVSSPQLDSAERGFSFQQDGPLDMRMDPRQQLTAANLVNEASADELARIFWELGDERQARRFARAIEQERAQRRSGARAGGQQRRIETTAQLAKLIERLAPRRGKKTHPATRIFQALRLAVNEEISSLERGLAAALKILKPGGRLVVITFHSIEDRVVKDFGRERTREYTFEGEVDVPELRRPRVPEMKWVQRKAVKPSPAELAANPRCRSAQLRVLEKI
ncbi:MAG: 16S rRNA (cytosine(1402)-N(4))-methyltransferase RsmH [Verrucomicrobia bacterium]|nr:16S rRNA (cytosine(1402)-N(4))-methyltransferase RsmH [Verrucomicrobiota bacterium]